MHPTLTHARFVPFPAARFADEELWDLVDHARSGDTRAFGQFFAATASAVFAYICPRMRGDRAAAEDVTADVYLGARRGLATVRRVTESPIAWLITIARRRVIDHYRRSRYRNVLLAGAPADLAVIRGASTVAGAPLVAETAENHYVARADVPAVWRHVEQLTPDQQRVLRCRFWFGLSVSETATILGKPNSAIKSLQYRALQSLRQQLAGTEMDPTSRARLVAA